MLEVAEGNVEVVELDMLEVVELNVVVVVELSVLEVVEDRIGVELVVEDTAELEAEAEPEPLDIGWPAAGGGK